MESPLTATHINMGGAAEVDASRRADDTELEDDDEPDEWYVVVATNCLAGDVM